MINKGWMNRPVNPMYDNMKTPLQRLIMALVLAGLASLATTLFIFSWFMSDD